MNLTIKQGDIFQKIKEIPNDSIDLCITSPPYWKLRNYGIEDQLGNEPTIEAYLDNTLRWVKEVYRALKPTGSFVLNIGDCFEKDSNLLSVSSFAYCRIISETEFICRGEHIWAKPNVPSPIRCRLKHSHEKLFWFVKDANKYYFDAKPWMKKNKDQSIKRQGRNSNTDGAFAENIGLSQTSCYRKKPIKERNKAYGEDQSTTPGKRGCGMTNEETIEHSWRVIAVGARQYGFEMEEQRPISEHVAPFPSALIEPYIKSLCPKDGIVLDTFLGSGTTMRVAMENYRDAIGIELNPNYVEFAKKRLNWCRGIGVEYHD
jgi:DNA modification methylase